MSDDKGALAALFGVVLAGSGLLDFGRASGTAASEATAADAGRESAPDANDAAQQAQQAPRTGLVFVNDYQPGVGFRAVSRVQQPTVNEILGYVNPESPGDSDGAVVDPAEWNGYIVNYQGCGPGNYTIIFLREGFLESGQTYSFTTDAVFFSNSLQLVEPAIRTGTPDGRTPTEDGGEGAAEDEGTAEGEAQGEGEGETATTEATTTEETTTTETTTTTEETTTTTAEETTTTTPEQTTTTTPGETTTANGTTTTPDETTTQEVIVNATETTTEGG